MNSNSAGDTVPFNFYTGTYTVPFSISNNDQWEEEETTIIKKKSNGDEEITVVKRKRRATPCAPVTWTPWTPGTSPTVTVTATGNEEPCLFDNWDWIKNPVAMLSCPCPKCSPRYSL